MSNKIELFTHLWIQTLVRFPQLSQIIQHLTDASTGSLEQESDLKNITYASVIDAYGGPNSVTNTLLACIPSDIRAF
ncbi:hypothetical protein VTN96DRAFT_5187 [Rasamsonia emersonii]